MSTLHSHVEISPSTSLVLDYLEAIFNIRSKLYRMKSCVSKFSVFRLTRSRVCTILWQEKARSTAASVTGIFNMRFAEVS